MFKNFFYKCKIFFNNNKKIIIKITAIIHFHQVQMNNHLCQYIKILENNHNILK